mgnify:CR=1 FL=1
MNGTKEDTLLAKSDGESLFEHTYNVIRAISELVTSLPEKALLEYGNREKIFKMATECALFHDTGKAALGFQDVLKGERANWGGKRHCSLAREYRDRSKCCPPLKRGRNSFLTL